MLGSDSLRVERSADPLSRSESMQIRGGWLAGLNTDIVRVGVRVTARTMSSKQQRALSLRIFPQQRDCTFGGEQRTIRQFSSTSGESVGLRRRGDELCIVPVAKIRHRRQSAPSADADKDNEKSHDHADSIGALSV